MINSVPLRSGNQLGILLIWPFQIKLACNLASILSFPNASGDIDLIILETVLFV